MKQFSIVAIADKVKGTLSGNDQLIISGPEEIGQASNTQITFVGNKKFIKAWELSNACAAIINNDLPIEPTEGKAIVRVKDADIAMAEVLELFMPEGNYFESNIHPTAVIHPSAVIGENTKIGANCYVGKDVTIGNNTTIYPNVTIFDQVSIGHFTAIWSGTVIRERCVVGSYCILHANVSIGSGWLWIQASTGWTRIDEDSAHWQCCHWQWC